MFMRLAFVVGLSLVAATASGAPLTIRHGRAIHVEIGTKTEEAFALRAVAGGWRIELGAATNTTLVLRDVTRGATGAMRFELVVVDGAVTLDDARFRADHAYRVELRRGTAVIGGALIYLSPPRRSRGPIQFDDADANRPDDPGELRATDKGTL
jgi:hypothetical protein